MPQVILVRLVPMKPTSGANFSNYLTNLSIRAFDLSFGNYGRRHARRAGAGRMGPERRHQCSRARRSHPATQRILQHFSVYPVQVNPFPSPPDPDVRLEAVATAVIELNSAGDGVQHDRPASRDQAGHAARRLRAARLQREGRAECADLEQSADLHRCRSARGRRDAAGSRRGARSQCRLRRSAAGRHAAEVRAAARRDRQSAGAGSGRRRHARQQQPAHRRAVAPGRARDHLEPPDHARRPTGRTIAGSRTCTRVRKPTRRGATTIATRRTWIASSTRPACSATTRCRTPTRIASRNTSSRHPLRCGPNSRAQLRGASSLRFPVETGTPPTPGSTFRQAES